MYQIRSIIGFIVVAAFAVRCLVPMGFMLTHSADADHTVLGLKIVICTSHGPMTKSVGEEPGTLPGAPKHKTPQASHELCPFASQGLIADSAPVPDPLVATIRYAEIVYALTSQIYAATPRPGPTSARGPPSSTA